MVSAHFTSLNIEYIFLLIYNAAQHIINGSFSGGALGALLMRVWFIVAIIGYSLIVIAFLVLVYASMKLAEVRRRDKVIFGPLPTPPSSTAEKNPRWLHIQSLVGSSNINDWRQAIIEADIMLGEVLTSRGYQGESIGEQLKHVASSGGLGTLNDAWEAHKVRNEIAHQGMVFDFSEVLARRTIDRYGNVFRECNVI